MNGSLFDELIQNLSNHFEAFFSVMIVGALFFAVLFVSLRLREVSLRKIFRSAVQNVLFSIIVAGQVSLVLVVVFLLWANYNHLPSAFNFPDSVIPHAGWVRDSLRIYFVDGNRLRSVLINGKDHKEIFNAETPIRGYYFSPDGKSLLVASAKDLYHIDLTTKANRLIDSVAGMDSSGELRGAISGIRWGPKSRYFCYEVARWSRYSSQDSLYVYDLYENKKRSVKSPARRVSSLYWDKEGKALYYLRYEAMDTSVHAYPFEVRVFRIPLGSLEPEFVVEIPHEQASIPIANLNLRGIDLFIEGDSLSFVRGEDREKFISDKGKTLGIDEEDFLYYVPNRWFHKRLFQIPREADLRQLPRYQYKGGDLVVNQIRWLPGGRHVIMQHQDLGVLVLEPSTGKVGLLVQAIGENFGWYTDVFKDK